MCNFSIINYYKICLRIMTENLNNDEESRLIERLILGEEKAFCKLYVQYKPRLFKFAIALLKSQNVAEDICQDIFFNIWENRYFLKCGTSFSSFLFSMARNRIINYLRDESYHSHSRPHRNSCHQCGRRYHPLLFPTAICTFHPRYHVQYRTKTFPVQQRKN